MDHILKLLAAASDPRSGSFWLAVSNLGLGTFLALFTGLLVAWITVGLNRASKIAMSISFLLVIPFFLLSLAAEKLDRPANQAIEKETRERTAAARLGGKGLLQVPAKHEMIAVQNPIPSSSVPLSHLALPPVLQQAQATPPIENAPVASNTTRSETLSADGSTEKFYSRATLDLRVCFEGIPRSMGMLVGHPIYNFVVQVSGTGDGNGDGYWLVAEDGSGAIYPQVGGGIPQSNGSVHAFVKFGVSNLSAYPLNYFVVRTGGSLDQLHMEDYAKLGKFFDLSELKKRMASDPTACRVTLNGEIPDTNSCGCAP